MWILLGGIICGVGWLYRNIKVYKEQIRVLHIVEKLAQRDIEYGRVWGWRYDDYYKVSYDKMCIQFWKPVGSFYSHLKWLEEKEIKS